MAGRKPHSWASCAGLTNWLSACRNGWRARRLGWPAPPTGDCHWRRPRPIPTLKCGPGCVYATKHPCHGFRRAWAALRYDERREVNKKKVHQLWREEGLQVRVHSPRKRAGVSSIPPIEADAPNVVWAIDFQFDSTVDGKAIKIASMIDEHTRESLLHVVERSITAEHLVTELEAVFAAAGGPPKVLRMDNAQSWVLERCNGSALGRSACPTSRPDRRGTTATSNRST